MSPRRWIIVCGTVLLSAWFTTADSKGTLSRRQFTDVAIRYVRSHHLAKTVKVRGDLVLECRDSTGAATMVGLGNAYLEYNESPELLDTLLGRYLEPVSLPKVTFDSAEIANILPVIRSQQYYRDQCSRFSDSPPSLPAADSLNSELAVMYVQDMPKHMAFCTQKYRTALDPGNSFFRDLALTNLRERFPETKMYRKDGYVMFVADGSYESSLILLDEYCSPWAYGWNDRLVAAIPARDLLFLTHEGDSNAVAAIKKIAEESDSMSHSISNKLFVRDTSGWVLYTPAK
jgi:hypothetical protein